MNGMPHTVNRVLGLISANFSRSAITVNRISEGVCSQQGLYISYTSRLVCNIVLVLFQERHKDMVLISAWVIHCNNDLSIES